MASPRLPCRAFDGTCVYVSILIDPLGQSSLEQAYLSQPLLGSRIGMDLHLRPKLIRHHRSGPVAPSALIYRVHKADLKALDTLATENDFKLIAGSPGLLHLLATKHIFLEALV